MLFINYKNTVQKNYFSCSTPRFISRQRMLISTARGVVNKARKMKNVSITELAPMSLTATHVGSMS